MATTATAINDTLSTTADYGFSTAFDWKGSYVDKLANQEGLERFSQFSASPDTTMLFAGPARFTGLSGGTTALIPVGLVDGISYQQTPQLQRLFEIGSNRSFFTRGKTMSTISFSKMLADQNNMLMALTQNSYIPNGVDTAASPATASTTPNIAMNLDSEYFNLPFGLMLLFKTRGGNGGDGTILSAIYLEYCMFGNYNFSISSGSPVIMDGVSIEFDRTVPVALL